MVLEKNLLNPRGRIKMVKYIDLNETLIEFLRQHANEICVDKNGYCFFIYNDNYYYITVKGGY